MKLAGLALGLLLLGTAPAWAESAEPVVAPVVFVGAGGTVALDAAALEALPQVVQKITFKTSKGMSTGVYKGPLLWDVVQAAKGVDGLGHNEELARTLLVTAADGYKIAFSIGELSPEFGNAMILVALETDGQKLKNGFRIVVQGDKRGARALHNVTSIEVK
ncbi:hypothetical protein BZU93_25620 [Salmonella enterica subsp. enterica]|nr:hypothetical protein [Salmonella enterica subsp. enterica serovar Enteritidis]